MEPWTSPQIRGHSPLNALHELQMRHQISQGDIKVEGDTAARRARNQLVDE